VVERIQIKNIYINVELASSDDCFFEVDAEGHVDDSREKDIKATGSALANC
jgi:hypothetical protein